MIPMECPKCGRRGNVPPDRLASRLSCKACGAVFHFDSTGQLVLGEPGRPEKAGKPKKAKAAKAARPDFEFDPKETWQNIPAPIKLAIPGVLVALIAWQFLFSGGSAGSHLTRSETIVRALLNGDKGTVTALATPETAEAAGQWFELMRKQLQEKKIPSDAFFLPSLNAGNVDSDSSLVVSAALAGADKTVIIPVNLNLKRSGGSWLFDAQSALSEAERAASAMAPSPGSSRRK